MGVSDLIASFIQEALAQEDRVELQRRDLAERFGCVPSQINYVMSTRFSPEHGYLVESRRGGNGYIRITRITAQPALRQQLLRSVGDTLEESTLQAIVSRLVLAGELEARDARLLLAATGDSALRAAERPLRDRLRASIFKQVLLQSLVD